VMGMCIPMSCSLRFRVEILTGSFHLVSHNASMPSWCGMRRSNVFLPMVQWLGVLPSSVAP
jgi:hypothetical protein